jgi:hypothetical protein
MRDWPNPLFAGTLEAACAAAAPYPDVARVALEVCDVDDGSRYVLAPAYDLGLPPWSGDLVRCSAISFEGLYRVGRVAHGRPGRMLAGCYPDDFQARERLSERRERRAS